MGATTSFTTLWFVSLHLGPCSQLLPAVAPQPFLLLFQCQQAWAGRGRASMAPALCSWARLLLGDLGWPSPVLPPQCSLPVAAPAHQSGGPSGGPGSSLARVCPQSKLSGSSASLWRKSALWTGEEASFILSANHVIIRELFVLPSFPTSPCLSRSLEETRGKKWTGGKRWSKLWRKQ